jgi:hypothetical protein
MFVVPVITNDPGAVGLVLTTATVGDETSPNVFLAVTLYVPEANPVNIPVVFV